MTRRAIELAENGNVQMLRFVLSRLLPPPPEDELLKLEELPSCDDLPPAGQLSSYVMEKLAEGVITPTQANVISGIVERHVLCLQSVDLEERLFVIEEALKAKR